jgi:hypothetical protein
MLRPLQPEGSLTSLDQIPNHAISGYIFTLSVLKTHFNIILPLSTRFLKWSLPFTFSRSAHVPCPFYLVLLHYIAFAILGAQHELLNSRSVALREFRHPKYRFHQRCNLHGRLRRFKERP